MNVAYLPLEPYEERYTAQLKGWTEARFRARGVAFETIEGDRLPGSGAIATGVALDAHGRTYYALTQTARLVAALRDGRFGAGDVVYNQDLFHPGWEALPYIFDQMPASARPACYTHSLAHSVDPHDFTFPMRRWMRHFELLVDRTAAAIFVASACQVPMHRVCLFDAPLVQVGLLFDRDEVRGRCVPPPRPWAERTPRVVFTSRWDREKQPGFFLDLVDRAAARLPGVRFAVTTSAPALRSNDPPALARARAMQAAGRLEIHEGLSKAGYYAILADSRVQFNCALQDFVSNTLNEASALGTPSLLPAHLSFPECAANDRRLLYTPWSVDDALDRLAAMLADPPLDVVSRPADVAHATLDRVIDAFRGGA